MSTESGKTCGCTTNETAYGEHGIDFCPLHSGEIAEKLAEALRALKALEAKHEGS